jgi:7-cyano-7-deazaguanine synthase
MIARMIPVLDHALVLFSGGQDSTTCLAWALRCYASVETIGFNYGQRHAIEMTCREPIRAAVASPGLGADHVIDLTAAIAGLGATALTSDATIAMTEEGLPNTFVPGRNLLFLTWPPRSRSAVECAISSPGCARPIIPAIPTGWRRWRAGSSRESIR